AEAVALDERDEYPAAACARLDAWGLPEFYVPEQWGGRLRSFEQLVALLRVTSRRDFTVGFAYSILSLLGSAATWAGGSEQQRRKVAQLLKEKKQIILAYNERAHGSDFLSTDLRAAKVDGGYLLSGEKWLIGNAVRCVALTTVARTRDEGGPRGFSLFLVEKSALDPGSFRHLDRIKTLGVRGAHVSGIKFENCFVPDEARIGGEGTALEQTLKAFQMTRALIPALSLGAADTALRCAFDFARARRLSGSSVWEMPRPRRTLVECFVDLLIADSLTAACARALHQTPEQMRLYSAAVKYFVTSEVEGLVERAAEVLGARHYLREGHWHGLFQKVLRDQMVVRYHFNSALTLTTVGVHLRDLARERARRDGTPDPEMEARLEAIFDLRAPLRPLDPTAFSLYERGRDDILHGLDSALATLRRRALDAATERRPLLDLLARQVKRLVARRDEADAAQRKVEQALGADYGRSPAMFRQAEDYCRLLAAASCLHLWLHSGETLGGFVAEGEWLVLALARLGGEGWAGLPVETERRAGEELERLFVEGRLFSLVPLQLARSNARGIESEGQSELAGEGLTAVGVG
ncbi:MAG TPA: acyl-CoA dehydrogenase family protein, partial [Pyrinomonadaceae bacterium]|nr:acyl-CoA dehydrogenase family protein [Pyrinomonadaceae bacterium]